MFGGWALTAMVVTTLLGAAWAGYTEAEGSVFIEHVQAEAKKLGHVRALRAWDYEVTLTDEAAKLSSEADEAYTKYQADIYPEVLKYPWKTYKDPLLRRLFKLQSQPDEAALTVAKRTRMSDVIKEMINIYSTTQIKEYKTTSNKDKYFVGEVDDKMATSNDSCELTYLWDGWQTKAGRGIKTLFQEYVRLENEEAVLNKFSDNAAKWQAKYETENFEGVMRGLMDQIRPLFLQLHAFVRKRLWLYYGKNGKIIDRQGPIPASLLASVWGMDGINVYGKTLPYPNKPSLDITNALIAQNYTGQKMAEACEDFYLSINLTKMPDSFWTKSYFERPATGNFDCSPMGYNFFDGKDYRIKICSTPTQDYFGRTCHEMGHLKNYIEWKNLPWLFEDAPNPGFNEALGDMMYLYAVSPNHLKTMGLLPSDFVIDTEQGINVLYQQALATVFFFPYAYSLERWRYGVFQGKITPKNYNCEYWRIRLEDQGVEPPVDRDEDDFDPGAKYHIGADLQYISYFVSGVLEYQFLKALCETAGQYDPKNPSVKPLYLCDIYNSKDAGNKLRRMMALGLSHPWPDALEILTGQRKMDAGPMLEFFKPLYDWLKKENAKTHEKIGWVSKRSRCFKKKRKPCKEDHCVYR